MRFQIKLTKNILILLIFMSILFASPIKADEIPDDEWSDLLKFYGNITVEYQNLRFVQNNKSSKIDVHAEYVSSSNPERIALYQLLGNGSLLVEIVDGSVTKTGDTYTNLKPNEKLFFTVKAKPSVASGSAQVKTKIQLIEKEELIPSEPSPIYFTLTIIKVPSYIVTFQKEFPATVSIENDNSMSHNVTIYWWITESETGEEVNSSIKTVILAANQRKEVKLNIPTPKNPGNYTFHVRVWRPKGVSVSGITDEEFRVIGLIDFLIGPGIWIPIVLVVVCVIVIYIAWKYYSD